MLFRSPDEHARQEREHERLLFVAFLQAFVFTLLTSVFIGLMRTEHE